MTLIINDRFSVDRDRLNWILRDTVTSVAKTGPNKGEEVKRVYNSYYGSLGSLCNHCLELGLDTEGGFESILKAIQEAREDLGKMVKAHDLELRRTIKEAGK